MSVSRCVPRFSTSSAEAGFPNEDGWWWKRRREKVKASSISPKGWSGLVQKRIERALLTKSNSEGKEKDFLRSIPSFNTRSNCPFLSPLLNVQGIREKWTFPYFCFVNTPKTLYNINYLIRHEVKYKLWKAPKRGQFITSWGNRLFYRR